MLVCSSAAHGAVNLDRTRLIFNENEKSVSLKIENMSKKLPYLAYSWTENRQGQKNDTFFVALPPLQRLEPGAISQVRVMKQPGVTGLPTDRESLFYFDLQEIPPQPELKGKNDSVMQLAMQSKIKLFYRPAALLTENIQSQALKMQIRKTAAGLQLSNPTPYHITLAWLGADMHHMLPGFKKGTMLTPFGDTTVPAGAGNDFRLGYIDDYGALRLLTLQCPGSSTCSVSEVRNETR
ncbi:TPA: molecular chaperone [Citrobacter werkmanii]